MSQATTTVNNDYQQFVPAENAMPEEVQFGSAGMYSALGDSGNYQGGINQEGKREGEGTCTWVDGSTYIGQWKNGMRHGKGVYTLADGTRYDGMWVEDRKQGQGELMLPSKEIIRCTW